MKKLFCMCILICLLLTSCGDGQGNLNVYTTYPNETQAPFDNMDDSTLTSTDTDTFETRGEIPEELRVYVPNYTYTPSDDSADKVTQRTMNSFSVSGDWLYYVKKESTPRKYNRLMRLNLKTGEISSPCLDPVCTHNTNSCPFQYGYIGNVRAYGRYVVFAGGSGATSADHIHIYDTETGKIHENVFGGSSGGSGSMYSGCIGDDAFGTVIIKTENPNATGSDDRTLYDVKIWKYNIPTGKLTEIHSVTSTKNVGGLALVHNGRIFAGDFAAGSDVEIILSSRLPDGSDVKEHKYFKTVPFYVGEMMYESSKGNIIAQNMTTGESSTVISSRGASTGYTLTNKYIYYYYAFPVDSDNPKGEKTYELWRSDHSGNNSEKLLTLKQGFSADFIVDGNYLYSYMAKDGQSYSNVARLDIETGEILYIE